MHRSLVRGAVRCWHSAFACTSCGERGVSELGVVALTARLVRGDVHRAVWLEATRGQGAVVSANCRHGSLACCPVLLLYCGGASYVKMLGQLGAYGHSWPLVGFNQKIKYDLENV